MTRRHLDLAFQSAATRRGLGVSPLWATHLVDVRHVRDTYRRARRWDGLTPDQARRETLAIFFVDWAIRPVAS